VAGRPQLGQKAVAQSDGSSILRAFPSIVITRVIS
jgi:hypothetical protein